MAQVSTVRSIPLYKLTLHIANKVVRELGQPLSKLLRGNSVASDLLDKNEGVAVKVRALPSASLSKGAHDLGESLVLFTVLFLSGTVLRHAPLSSAHRFALGGLLRALDAAGTGGLGLGDGRGGRGEDAAGPLGLGLGLVVRVSRHVNHARDKGGDWGDRRVATGGDESGGGGEGAFDLGLDLLSELVDRNHSSQ